MSNDFVPLEWNELPEDEMKLRANALYEQMNLRRTTRHFSERTVPREFIEKAIMCASTAPSGAHLQPWTFVAVSKQKTVLIESLGIRPCHPWWFRLRSSSKGHTMLKTFGYNHEDLSRRWRSKGQITSLSES